MVFSKRIVFSLELNSMKLPLDTVRQTNLSAIPSPCLQNESKKQKMPELNCHETCHDSRVGLCAIESSV